MSMVKPSSSRYLITTGEESWQLKENRFWERQSQQNNIAFDPNLTISQFLEMPTKTGVGNPQHMRGIGVAYPGIVRRSSW